jgi:hypothetical protein
MKNCFPVEVTFVKRNLVNSEVQTTEKMNVIVRLEDLYLGLLKGSQLD